VPRLATQLLDDEFLRTIEQLSLVSRKVFAGKMKGERRSKKRGVSIEFADYRDYSQGDDLRFIDWNIYGRLDRLFLKLFLEEEDLNVFVLLDASQSMAFGTPSKLEYGKRVAAALAYLALCNMDRAAVQAFAGDLAKEFPLTRGRRMLWRLFDFLGGLEAAGPTALAPACRHFSMKRKGKGIVAVVSDFLDKNGYEEGLKFLMGQKYDVVVCQVLAPEEVDPPLEGDLKLVDIEDADVSEVSLTQELRKNYRRNLEALCGGLKEFCRARGFTYLFTTTDKPFDKLILNTLRAVGLVK
jgi:uncharacterized protein (DUF58 family)